VDLSQGQVDEFMAAQKVVPSASPIAWESRSLTQVIWQAPIEIDAVQQGTVFFYVNPTLPRRWSFKLSLHRAEIYRVDVKPLLRHSNPSGRPSDCPGKVTCPEHEHRWIEGYGLKCAWPLEDLSDASHQRILDVFCKRAHIDFGPEYSDPASGLQLEIG
jgi:hypothetical protein